MKKIRVGAGSSGWPDYKDGALDVAENGDVDYMAFDHLAELTMAILQNQFAKDPKRGYIPEVPRLMKQLLPIWKANGKRIKMVNNGGGANPPECANQVLQVAKGLDLGGFKIGVITGDTLPLTRLDDLEKKGFKFKNLDTGEVGLSKVRDRLLAAYVYVGADKVIEAFDKGADLVIGGRLSDNSLFIGPFMHGLGWKFTDEYWDRIGSGVTIGHILECSSWSAGTCSNLWEQIEYPKGNPGFPIAEMYENGDCIVTKTPTSGGIIKVLSAMEHLVYEVHDPHNYIMPDGISDITAIKIEQIGKDRIKITKAGDAPRGKARPETLKLCLAYNDGWIAEEITIIAGPKAFKQAAKAKDFVTRRLDFLGLKPREWLWQRIGWDSLTGPTVDEPPADYDPPELGIRIAFKCDTMEEARACRTECGHLCWASLGVGAGFTSPPDYRQVFAMWPTLIPREEVPLKLDMVEAK
jgi:hypothetical protein